MMNSAVRAPTNADVGSERSAGWQPANSDLQMQLDGEKSSEKTEETVSILDWLKDDHWWLVLDYVPVKDIILSECVSKRWREVVHRYLQEVGICVAHLRGWFAQRNVKRQPKNRIVGIESRNGKNVRIRFYEKWGPYMVYTYCTSRLELQSIVQHCPNLRGLAVLMDPFGSGPLSQNEGELCEKLEQLALIHFTHYYDFKLLDDDDRAFAYKKVEVNRAFWPNLNPANLRCLTVCGMFDFKHFLASIDCFPKLTELNVQGYHANTLLLLDKTPKLKRLAALETNIDLGSHNPKCKLDLEDLTLYEFSGAKWFETLADSELKSLTFMWANDDVQKTGLKLMKTRWRMLNEIRLKHWGPLTDDDAVAIINNCRYLTLLDICGCEGLSPELVERAARATRGRAAPLRLKIGDTKAAAAVDTFDQTQFSELIVDAQTPPNGPYPHQHIEAEY